MIVEYSRSLRTCSPLYFVLPELSLLPYLMKYSSSLLELLSFQYTGVYDNRVQQQPEDWKRFKIAYASTLPSASAFASVSIFSIIHICIKNNSYFHLFCITATPTRDLSMDIASASRQRPRIGSYTSTVLGEKIPNYVSIESGSRLGSFVASFSLWAFETSLVSWCHKTQLQI